VLTFSVAYATSIPLNKYKCIYYLCCIYSWNIIHFTFPSFQHSLFNWRCMSVFRSWLFSTYYNIDKNEECGGHYAIYMVSIYIQFCNFILIQFIKYEIQLVTYSALYYDFHDLENLTGKYFVLNSLKVFTFHLLILLLVLLLLVMQNYDWLTSYYLWIKTGLHVILCVYHFHQYSTILVPFCTLKLMKPLNVCKIILCWYVSWR
jgi:hypothetical protein